MSLIVDVTPTRGLTRVSGVVPNGALTVTRDTFDTRPFVLRGGILNVANTGFSLEDTEAPIGVPVTYTATSTVNDRMIQRNLVLTPDLRGFGYQTWMPGQFRAFDYGNDDGYGYFGSNAAGATQGIPGRTIAAVGVATLQPNTQYMVTGKVKFTTPDVWTWQDVRNAGSWQAVKTAKANWQAVRSTLSGGAPTDQLTTVYVSLTSDTSTYLAPMQVITIPMNRTNEWVTFSAYFTTPANIGPARLQIMHGTSTREYSVSWALDEFGIMLKSEADRMLRLFWFKGTSEVPDRPQDYLMQNSEWEDVSHDARIIWEGTPGASVSRFESPSKISTSKTVTINVPDNEVPCEPVLLSDPVSSALAQWFGLASMGTLSRAARTAVLAVLGRSDYVASSSVRGMATGTLELFTDTLEDRTNAIGLLQSGRVLLLRNPNPDYPETNWYIAIGDVDENRTIEDNARLPGRTWTVPFVQVERPAGMIQASTGRTWGDILATGKTWKELRDTTDNWLQVAV